MKSPTASAIVSALLLLPFAAAFLIARLGIEPANSMIRELGTGPDGRTNPAGYAAQIGILVLVIAAAFVSWRSVMTTVRERGQPFANPVNLALAGVATMLLLGLGAGIVVDQFPCWMGEPNCD